MKKIITIDGPSASGKSTVAKRVAKNLNFEHLDTGAIYRSLAWWCLHTKVSTENELTLSETLNRFNYEVKKVQDKKRHFVNGKDITDEIRTNEISQLSSKIAVIPIVREVANKIQRRIAESSNVVVEGRDAGTVVFPHADLKIFLTAQMKERARRRMEELKQRYPEYAQKANLESVMQEIKERDERDTHRDVSPLKKPLDAISIDTTDLTPEKITKVITKEAKGELLRKPSRFWGWIWNEDLARAPFLYNFTRLWVLGVYRLFYRIRAYGLENYPKGAAIIAPNHISNLDPPAIGVTAPVPLHSLGKQSLFKVPLLKRLLPKLLSHPVSGTVYDTGVIKLVVSLLRKGKQVLIFPEGARSFDGRVAPLKRGVGVLTSMTECKVVPTLIVGTYEIWPRKKRFPKLWGKISVYYDKPLEWQHYRDRFPNRKDAEEELIKDLEGAIRALAIKHGHAYHRT